MANKCIIPTLYLRRDANQFLQLVNSVPFWQPRFIPTLVQAFTNPTPFISEFCVSWQRLRATQVDSGALSET